MKTKIFILCSAIFSVCVVFSAYKAKRQKYHRSHLR